jgi:hypothetical protein
MFLEKYAAPPRDFGDFFVEGNNIAGLTKGNLNP